jgi:secernin
VWWRHEQFHREVIRDYASRLSSFESERDKLEEDFLASAAQCQDSPEARRDLSAKCFQTADQCRERWSAQVQSKPLTRQNRFYYNLAWNTFRKKAGLA